MIAFLQSPLEGAVLETYGSGNAPDNRPDLLAELKKATDRGVIIMNCTQCLRGTVNPTYATGKVRDNQVFRCKCVCIYVCVDLFVCVYEHIMNTLLPQVLMDAGLIPGRDMTPEAALCKLSYVLARTELSLEDKKKVRWSYFSSK